MHRLQISIVDFGPVLARDENPVPRQWLCIRNVHHEGFDPSYDFDNNLIRFSRVDQSVYLE